MKIFALFILVYGLAISAPLIAQQDSAETLRSFGEELERLQVTTALLLPSEGVDYYPTWSPEGDKLGANIMGTWYEVDLEELILVEASWRDDQKLGVINSNSSFAESDEAGDWFDQEKFDPRNIETSDGTIIELAQEGFAITFRITFP